MQLKKSSGQLVPWWTRTWFPKPFQPRCEASGSLGGGSCLASIGTRMPCGTLVDVKVTGTIMPYRARAVNGQLGRARSGGAYGYHHNPGHSSYCYRAGRWRILRSRTLVLRFRKWIISTTAFWRLAGFLPYLCRLFLQSFWPTSSSPEPRQSVSHPSRLSGALESYGLAVLPLDRDPCPKGPASSARGASFFVLSSNRPDLLDRLKDDLFDL